MSTLPTFASRRSMRALLVVVPALFALSAAAQAAAVEVAAGATTTERRHSLRLDGGFLSPLGFGGVAYSYDAAKHLTLEAGVGYGFSGLQLSVMPKLVLGNGTHSALLGLGASVGIDPESSRRVVWPFFNAEIGYQLRAQSGFVFQVSGGLTASYYKVSNHAYSGNLGPSLRIGFGYSFSEDGDGSTTHCS